MATKTPTTRATPTRTSPTTGTEVRAAPESATTATESSGIDWDALGWVAALGGTGSVAAYFVTRASKTGDGSDDE